MPCIACRLGNHEQIMPTEAHHLNLGGNAGQKRRGDDYSIPLCSWHHRSDTPPDVTKAAMTAKYGPSLATNSKAFRRHYGFDDDLLVETNMRLMGLF